MTAYTRQAKTLVKKDSGENWKQMVVTVEH